MIHGCHLLSHGMLPLLDDWLAVLKQETSSDGSEELHHQWSQRSWLEPLKKLSRVRGNILTLSQCGFTVPGTATTPDLSTISMEGGEITYEHTLARTAVRLQHRLVSNRVGSQLRSSDLFPTANAGILKETTVAATMADFKTAVQAWQVCGKQPQPVCKALHKRSPFNTPLGKWHVAFGLSVNFSHPVQQLKDLVRYPRRGLTQSYINEKANRIIKEAARQGGRNKIIKNMAIWRAPIRERLFDEFHRTEIVPTSNAPVPSDATLSRLFTHNRVVDASELPEEEKRKQTIRDQWTKQTNRIVNREDAAAHDFVTYTALSRQELIAEQKLHIFLHEAGRWDEVDTAWYSSLVLANQVIIIRVPGGIFHINDHI